jgi:hypothetical protein
LKKLLISALFLASCHTTDYHGRFEIEGQESIATEADLLGQHTVMIFWSAAQSLGNRVLVDMATRGYPKTAKTWFVAVDADPEVVDGYYYQLWLPPTSLYYDVDLSLVSTFEISELPALVEVGPTGRVRTVIQGSDLSYQAALKVYNSID